MLVGSPDVSVVFPPILRLSGAEPYAVRFSNSFRAMRSTPTVESPSIVWALSHSMDRPINSDGIFIPGVVPMLTLANVDVVAAAIVMDVLKDLVWTGVLLSVTVAVKLNVPLAVGVPEIVPVAAATLSPVGKLPELTDQE